MAFRIPISYEHPTRSPHNTLDDDLIGDNFFNAHDEHMDLLDVNTRLFEYTHSYTLPKQDELDDWDFLEEETMNDTEREEYEKDLKNVASSMEETIKYQQERETLENKIKEIALHTEEIDAKEPEETTESVEEVEETKKPAKEFVCPRDPETIEKVTRIIKNEFEFEILNKERELSLIEERLAEADSLLRKLTDSCWGPARRKRKIESLVEKEKEIEIEEDRKMRKKKTKIVIEPNAKALYVRTQDGAFLQLSCPQCKRWRFVNKLGFVNHCRIVHQLKFSSFEDAAQHCGKVVDDSEVPSDDAVRNEKPINMVLDPNNPIYVPPRPPPAPVAPTPVPEPAPTPVPEPAPTQITAPLDPDSISRFYIKKRIIVGNTSKHIIRKEGDMASHKWVLYLRGPEEDPDVTHFVKKVRFYLDDSFAPNNIVDVVEPPFQLSRRGWGEFTARVQIYFHGPKNKAVTVFHKLKLDKSRSGLRTLGAETVVDVELDRKFYEQQNPDRVSQTKEPAPASPPPAEVPQQAPPTPNTNQSTPIAKPIPQVSNNYPLPPRTPETPKTPEPPRLATPMTSPITSPLKRVTPPFASSLSMRTPEITATIEKYLKDALNYFPLVVIDPSKKPSTPVGYSIACSDKEWKDWSLAKRKAIEWRRAKKVQQYLKNHQKTSISCKSIVIWCRANNQVPQDYLTAPSTAIVIPPPPKATPPPYKPATPVIPPRPVIPPNLANKLGTNPMPIVPQNKPYTPVPTKAIVYPHPPPTKNLNYQNLPRPSHLGVVITPAARASSMALYSPTPQATVNSASPIVANGAPAMNPQVPSHPPQTVVTTNSSTPEGNKT